MEAPKKLFIKPEKIKVEMIPGGELPNVGIQYIRKDLLLKWAKDNLLECEASNDETDYGRIDAYKKLIDKLNSL